MGTSLQKLHVPGDFSLLELFLLSEDILRAGQALLHDTDDRNEHFAGDTFVELNKVLKVEVFAVVGEHHGHELSDLLLVRSTFLLAHVLTFAAVVKTFLKWQWLLALVA